MSATEAGAPGRSIRTVLGSIRLAYLPVLVTYFAYGASSITGVALLYLQKETLHLSPADVAEVGFWATLPWSTKMVVGAAADTYPLFGSRRASYLVVGVFVTALGYFGLATVTTKGTYLVASVLVATGFMIQDVIADALSAQVAETEEEVAQVQTLGRMALLAGMIPVGYLGGVLAARLGPRGVMSVALLFPALVAFSALQLRGGREPAAPTEHVEHLGAASPGLVIGLGVAYALFGVTLQMLAVPRAQEIVLVVSGVLLVVLLRRVGITRAVAVAAFVIFLFRATPNVGQGYNYWAIDTLGFDQEFLGVLAQAGAIVGLVGLVVFRKRIVKAPVSTTLLWVTIAGTILYLPNVGLFYGLADWLGVSPRTIAFVDTTISAPLTQLAMVPMLTLIAKIAPKGAEATMFAIMASLMNLALSASELFTRWLNEAFGVTQENYSNLGLLMIAVGVINVVPLLALPWLRRLEQADALDRRPHGTVD